MSVLLVTGADMQRHDAGRQHPERPSRLAAAAAGVSDGASEAGAELVIEAPEEADEAAIHRVHDAPHVAMLDRIEAMGGGWVDPDTAIAPGSMLAARLAAGGTVRAAEAAYRGEAAVAFAVVRPPGHHASRGRAAGFCLLNNIAIAVEAVRAGDASRRIAILDWDVHHGDGTQAIYDTDAAVCYASTHEWGIYPGTGARGDRGSGEATGTKHNAPLAAGSGDTEFVTAWVDVLLPAVEAFAPDAILVSAGYDAHRDDPLATLNVTEAAYRAVSMAAGELATRLGIAGVALTLEGGYDLEALRRSTGATVAGLSAGLGAA